MKINSKSQFTSTGRTRNLEKIPDLLVVSVSTTRCNLCVEKLSNTRDKGSAKLVNGNFTISSLRRIKKRREEIEKLITFTWK